MAAFDDKMTRRPDFYAIDGDLENDGSDGGSAGDVEEEEGDASDSDSNCGAAGNFPPPVKI